MRKFFTTNGRISGERDRRGDENEPCRFAVVTAGPSDGRNFAGDLVCPIATRPD